jgi:hypothetical protein
MIEDKNEDKYEKPDVTQIVHALIIYALVVFFGFCLLIGLANKKQPNQDKVFLKKANCQLETGSDCWPPQPIRR